MKLKVGYADVEVLPLSSVRVDDEDANGLFLPNQSQIMVRRDAPPPEQARILLHEITHALWHFHGLPATVTEEQACERLDRGLAALFRDNPSLLGVLHQALNNGKAIVK